jgi:hypothetical protein
MIDYLIIGGGIAGLAFAVVAGGIYNPVVLKRFRMVYQAGAYLEEMNRFFDHIREFYGIDYRNPIQILRRFSSVE